MSLTSPALAQSVAVIATDAPVIAIISTPRGVFAETERGTLRLAEGSCPGDICATSDVIRGLAAPAPDGALPDGKIATASTGDIRKAWYGQPTTRYDHGVLGDAIEGGSLVVALEDGTKAEFVLPDNQAFEDITPRIADLTGDGQNEVITIRASLTGGAAVVIFGLRDGALVEVAASSENGRRNRWLNIASIGGNAISFVRTPHIGGRLATLEHTGQGQWKETNDIVTGVSNHVIGSRELAMSATIRVNDRETLVLPSQDRQSLVLISGGETRRIDLPGAINKAIAVIGNRLVTATEDGQLLVIVP